MPFIAWWPGKIKPGTVSNQMLSNVDMMATFADLAGEVSLDPGSGPQGGDLGWFALGQMVPEFEQAVVEAEPGTVTAPVESQFGWHLIKVLEQRDHDDTDGIDDPTDDHLATDHRSTDHCAADHAGPDDRSAPDDRLCPG